QGTVRQGVEVPRQPRSGSEGEEGAAGGGGRPEPVAQARGSRNAPANPHPAAGHPRLGHHRVTPRDAWIVGRGWASCWWGGATTAHNTGVPNRAQWIERRYAGVHRE